MAQAPRAAWSELGKPAKQLYDMLGLRDQELPNVLNAAEILPVVDVTQNGWGEQVFKSGWITNMALSPDILFGPANKLSATAPGLGQASDLTTDDFSIIVIGMSILNSTAGALAFTLRLATPTSTDSAIIDAPLVFSVSALGAGAESIVVGTTTPYLVIPAGCRLAITGMNGANVFCRYSFVKVRAGHRPVR